jgi:hypothetical protein
MNETMKVARKVEKPLKLPLEFEEVLEDLLKIKPVDNLALTKSVPKKKSRPKK